MSVAIDASQLQIEGNCASKIHADTAKIVLQRDSLPLAGSDTVYVLHTAVTLQLDTTYFTDQMDTLPDLRLNFSDGDLVTTLHPTDSLLQNTLLNFVCSSPGVSTTIAFQGEITRNAMLRLGKEGGKAVFTGFSFQYADPEIARQVDEFYQTVTAVVATLEYYKQNREEILSKPMEERMRNGLMVLGALNNVVEMRDKVAPSKKRMTERQLEKYLEAAEALKGWLDYLKL